ncbi:hypothetical protein LX15_002636 [Streptoalloteichus tenebrarius]|uniref:Secreted protein n=1 Tax=Streptoalloteichus tenebrarius (strain ATCC 17920 / DSM 40477 / JCM 4838 / CBS 697.72 / NBRC 16177 / NCIMB 11028 / NRRL B-12390 / A12253. 1 / ISP 5477) TaxID=1933 RepID=A0ABT1HTW6_STRSD|nr:hypothetical protein [Streptoalloteichus tenebrarius]MCP2258937.1 hypothetical protein [Streptoalloteichus tenebrarius]BFF01145.1 hypothetical protein GCM10020241_28200 [Streptoalloteichus tenebrarius]
MLRKTAGVLAATAAALLIVGGPAWASGGNDHSPKSGHSQNFKAGHKKKGHGHKHKPSIHEHNYVSSEDNDWNGAVNVLNANQIQVPIGLCGIIPILGATSAESCAAAAAQQDF